MDDIKGRTLEERAKLVLGTLGKTSRQIKQAYRNLAKQYHPDNGEINTKYFQIVNEAYEFLTKGVIGKNPLLAKDNLIVKLTGKFVVPLFDKQQEWEEYERWRRHHFYGDNGEFI